MPIIQLRAVEVRVETFECRVDDPTSRRFLDARVDIVGEDLVVAVGGGARPHIGCVVLAQPGRLKARGEGWSVSCSVLTIPPHKEEPIARAVATRIVETLGTVAVVTAGVHDDEIDADGIATYLRLGEELAEKLANDLATR
jgi:hypothetical protein